MHLSYTVVILFAVQGFHSEMFRADTFKPNRPPAGLRVVVAGLAFCELIDNTAGPERPCSWQFSSALTSQGS